MNWYVMVWKKYAEFNGRARRTEYWMFTLFNALAGMVLGLVGVAGIVTSQDSNSAVIFYVPLVIYSLASLIPSLAVTTRRLHDTGKSGWFLLLLFVPFVNIVGSIIILVFCCLDSTPGPNQYGPNPKYPDQMYPVVPGTPGYPAMGYPVQPQPPLAYPPPPPPPVAYPPQPQPPMAYPPPPQPLAGASGYGVCKTCGAQLEGPSAFCGRCGARV